MKGAGFLDLLARWMPATNSLKSIGLPLGLAVTLALTAVTQGPALIERFRHRHDAKAAARITSAASAIGVDAAATMAAHARDAARLDTVTQEAARHVTLADDAAIRAPATAHALHDALCLSRAYAAEPDCAALRGDGAGVGAAGADAGRDPAGGR